MAQNGKISPVTVMRAHSERVKMVDMHPKEPLMLCALYSGIVNLWNYETETMLKAFDSGTNTPVRCARFIPRLQSFVCGADDFNIRVFNYNTMEKTKTFKAHDDYIRGIAVHDQLPIILTCSDDLSIRQWDWSKDWSLQMTYEGHMHFVMAVTFNPKDASTFATASLDQTIKIWNLSNPYPNYQLEGHEDGVNCVEYYPGGDKPHLISGGDDCTVRVWDYQTKACLHKFDRHSANVTAVLFHPDKPLIFTTSEDKSVMIYTSDTFRFAGTVDYGMGRGWALTSKRHTNAVAMGFDEGVVVVKVGDDKPVFSMHKSGKVLVAMGNDLMRMDIKLPAGTDTAIADGDVLALATKDQGATESPPVKMTFNSDGKYVALISETEYIINSMMGWRAKTYGAAMSFVWGLENDTYAVLESSTTVRIFRSFKEVAVLKLLEPAQSLASGSLLGVISSSGVTFYDWKSLTLVRCIQVAANLVIWNESGELVAITTESGIFILKYNSELVEETLQGLAKGADLLVDGEITAAFDVADEVDEQVLQAVWTKDCLAYINSAHRLNYYVGGETSTLAVLSRSQYLLGYLLKENRVFCIDKERNVTSYQLLSSVIDYKTAIVREDYDDANAILASIPMSARYKVAQFLQSRGLLEMAVEVTTDEDHRFDLVVSLGNMPVALAIAKKAPSLSRWKQVGDLAVAQGFLDAAAEAYQACGDYSGLLLLYSCTNDAAALSKLGDTCLSKGNANIAFTCFHLVGRHADCVDLLCETERIGDAAFYARMYCHSKIDEVVSKWKKSVAGIPHIRDAIASPLAYPNLFPSLAAAAAAQEEEEEEKEEQQVQEEEEEQEPEHVPVPTSPPQPEEQTPPQHSEPSPVAQSEPPLVVDAAPEKQVTPVKAHMHVDAATPGPSYTSTPTPPPPPPAPTPVTHQESPPRSPREPGDSPNTIKSAFGNSTVTLTVDGPSMTTSSVLQSTPSRSIPAKATDFDDMFDDEPPERAASPVVPNAPSPVPPATGSSPAPAFNNLTSSPDRAQPPFAPPPSVVKPKPENDDSLAGSSHAPTFNPPSPAPPALFSSPPPPPAPPAAPPARRSSDDDDDDDWDNL